MEPTANLIKSCITSKSGDMRYEDLNREFENIVGEPIPYKRLGFHNLYSLLKQIDGIDISYNGHHERILTVTDQKITHLNSLIRKQKRDYLKRKDRRYIRFAPYSNSGNEQRKRNEQQQRRNARRDDRHKQFAEQRDGYYDDIEDSYNEAVVIESNSLKETDAVYEPRFAGQQLIGDDFFLQLAIRNLGQSVWRHGDSLALHCGLCRSGQTIRDCIESFAEIESISNRVIIMLGSVDVYNGATCEDMIADMEQLLELLEGKFSLSKSAIALCTLPPLGNLSVCSRPEKAMAFYSFNSWIRSLDMARNTNYPNKCRSSYRIVDTFESFVEENYTTNYDLFQIAPRMVSGTRHPYLLWNKKGRKIAVKTLRGDSSNREC